MPAETAETAERAAKGNAKPSNARDVHAQAGIGEGFLFFYRGGVKGWRIMTRMVRVEIQLVVLLGARQTH